jgi:uncharacterized protein DUF4328
MLRQKSDGSAPDREFRPLRTLARALTAVLAGDVVLTVAILIAQLVNLGQAPWQVDAELQPLAGLFHAAVITTEVLFLIWFRRARINAERGCWQSRARPWTLWGWIVPVANLWIPFQIMRDVWWAGLQREHRTSTAGLPALWWASYLLVKPVSLAFPGGWSQRAWYGLLVVPDNWLSLTLFAIAGILLIAIVGTVSSGPVGSPNEPEHAPIPQTPTVRNRVRPVNRATMKVIALVTHALRSVSRDGADGAAPAVADDRRARHRRPGGRPARGLDEP